MKLFKTLKAVTYFTIDNISTTGLQLYNIYKGDEVETVWLSVKFYERHPKTQELTIRLYMALSHIAQVSHIAYETVVVSHIELQKCKTRDDVKKTFSL